MDVPDFAVDWASFPSDDELISLSQVMDIPTQQLVDMPCVTRDNKGRFSSPVKQADLENIQKCSVPIKTRNNNKWVLNLWKDWVDNRNSKPETYFEKGKLIPTDINTLNDEELQFWLQRFIVEIRRKDGTNYPPNTLVQIVSGLQRYIKNDCNRNNVHILRDDDEKFSTFRKILDSEMKRLTSLGFGTKVKSCEPVLPGVFSMNTAEGLSNAIFFYNGKAFAFRGMEQHKCVEDEQFEILTDQKNKRKFIRFTPRIQKNSQGGLKRKNVTITPIEHYEQPDNERCLVKMYDYYLSLIPRKGFLYKKTLTTTVTDESQHPRFSAANITFNKLSQMFKKFYQQAGLSIEGRTISNHSGRVTCCTTLYNDGFSDKAVTSRSAHRSNAVQKYQRELFSIKDSVSKSLGPPEINDIKTTGTQEDNDEIQEIKKLKTCVNQDVPSSANNTLEIIIPDCVNKVVLRKKDKTVTVEI
ncbi:hypothetical protein SNE40_004747 [Patella caerulea]|uniref:DUF3504 domain-containing protein n=1 Tax=Patella caerulea TaxID=87958 RepID=A0AAN8PXJ7_PATCE